VEQFRSQLRSKAHDTTGTIATSDSQKRQDSP
jgi:hypothetical protein